MATQPKRARVAAYVELVGGADHCETCLLVVVARLSSDVERTREACYAFRCGEGAAACWAPAACRPRACARSAASTPALGARTGVEPPVGRRRGARGGLRGDCALRELAGPAASLRWGPADPSVRVNHCRDAYAVVLAVGGARVAYSGDCRPSDAFAAAAARGFPASACEVLIHEATFDDGEVAHAVAKRHSTVSEALDVAKRAQATTCVLTHFSQRYGAMSAPAAFDGLSFARARAFAARSRRCRPTWRRAPRRGNDRSTATTTRGRGPARPSRGSASRRRRARRRAAPPSAALLAFYGARAPDRVADVARVLPLFRRNPAEFTRIPKDLSGLPHGLVVPETLRAPAHAEAHAAVARHAGRRDLGAAGRRACAARAELLRSLVAAGDLEAAVDLSLAADAATRAALPAGCVLEDRPHAGFADVVTKVQRKGMDGERISHVRLAAGEKFARVEPVGSPLGSMKQLASLDEAARVSESFARRASERRLGKIKKDPFASGAMGSMKPLEANVRLPWVAVAEDEVTDYVTGAKSLLIVPVCYNDESCDESWDSLGLIASAHDGDPYAYFEEVVSVLNAYADQSSFGRVSFEATYADMVTLDTVSVGQCGSIDSINYWSGGDNAYDTLSYPVLNDAGTYGSVPEDWDYASVYAYDYDASVAHELGHNFGANHASYMTGGERGAVAYADDEGSWVEYGSPYSTMGQGDIEDDLGASAQFSCNPCGPYTLNRIDDGTLPAEGDGTVAVVALSCEAADTYFFLEHRVTDTSGTGVLLHWASIDDTYGGTGYVSNTVTVDAHADTSSWADAALYPGESLTIDLTSSSGASYPVIVEAVETDAGALEVTITASDTAPPTVTPAPSTAAPIRSPTTESESCGSVCCDTLSGLSNTYSWSDATRIARTDDEDGYCCSEHCSFAIVEGSTTYYLQYVWSKYYITATDPCHSSGSLSYYDTFQPTPYAPTKTPTAEPSPKPTSNPSYGATAMPTVFVGDPTRTPVSAPTPAPSAVPSYACGEGQHLYWLQKGPSESADEWEAATIKAFHSAGGKRQYLCFPACITLSIDFGMEEDMPDEDAYIRFGSETGETTTFYFSEDAAVDTLFTFVICFADGAFGNVPTGFPSRDAGASPSPRPRAPTRDSLAGTSWYTKKSKNTCEKYVAKKAKNCKKTDDFDVKGQVACALTCGECTPPPSPYPSSAPTVTLMPTTPADDCADSTSWYCASPAPHKKSKDTCEDYVAKKSKNCKKYGFDGTQAHVPAPAANKKSKDTCADYVTKKSKNCKKDGFDGTPAESACPVTCGAC
ncbi:3'-tRNA processing endoribonuclease [Aureococcus anophagefferens]|nr:3'-tRNA processing endoribonuclease [Aureococcus anophagefferens]